MRGDVVVVQEAHRQAAANIAGLLMDSIRRKGTRYTISIAGESGCGKSATGKAITEELERRGIGALVLGQDDYFVLPPRSNDMARRNDPQWLGPHVEVRLDLMEANLASARRGAKAIVKPLVDYASNSIQQETIPLDGIQVVIAEGTYTSLLRNVDTRIFIARDWRDTLEDRKKRNRGTEAEDPFIEQVLAREHQIIAGHKQLADMLITRDYHVVAVE